MNPTDLAAKAEFYHLSRVAIREGLLTEQERDVLCRAGTASRDDWLAHLVRLRRALVNRDREE